MDKKCGNCKHWIEPFKHLDIDLGSCDCPLPQHLIQKAIETRYLILGYVSSDYGTECKAFEEK